MTERRVHPRFTLIEPCFGRFGNFQRFQVEEIALEGLRLLSSYAPACGHSCHLYLESSDSLQDFSVSIQRVMVQRFNNAESDLFRAGPLYSIAARFEEMGTSGRHFLVRLLESCYASQPATSYPADRAGEAGPSPLPSRPPRRAVLIADDDAAIRDMLVEILKLEGFPVLQAQDGVEACELFELNREAIGLVTLDIDMPRRNGYDAYRIIRALDPQVRVLFISGAIRFPRQQIPDAEWLDKPFGTETFIRFVTGAVGVAGPGRFTQLADAEMP